MTAANRETDYIEGAEMTPPPPRKPSECATCVVLQDHVATIRDDMRELKASIINANTVNAAAITTIEKNNNAAIAAIDKKTDLLRIIVYVALVTGILQLPAQVKAMFFPNVPAAQAGQVVTTQTHDAGSASPYLVPTGQTTTTTITPQPAAIP